LVRDSAGIEIVENQGSRSGIANRWVVSKEPIIRIGSRAGVEAEQFSYIRGVSRTANGEIVVLEGLTSELRFFDSLGTHRNTVGGQGEGPGEFRQAYQLGRLGGDTLAVWDIQARSLNLFLEDGTYLHRERILPRSLFPAVEWSSFCYSLPLLPNGAVLNCAQETGVTEGPQQTDDEGLHRSGVRLLAARRDLTTLDTLGVFLGPEHFVLEKGGGVITDGSPPFPSRGYLAVSVEPLRLYLANNPEYSIEVWVPGPGLTRVVRRNGARWAPSQEEVDAAWAAVSADVGEEFTGRVKAISPTPSLIPAVSGLVAGPGGELWVRRGARPESPTFVVLDVFDGSGVFLGEVEIPAEFDIKEVGDDFLLGIRLDEFDIPFVELYSLDRGEP
jgi:hypothetical protein